MSYSTPDDRSPSRWTPPAGSFGFWWKTLLVGVLVLTMVWLGRVWITREHGEQHNIQIPHGRNQ